MGPSFDKKTKSYIPSTINTQKKLLKIAIWADQTWAGFWQIKKYSNLIILNFQVHLFLAKKLTSEITDDSKHYLIFYCYHNPLWLPEDKKSDNLHYDMLG